jgi:hypothetical protein
MSAHLESVAVLSSGNLQGRYLTASGPGRQAKTRGFDLGLLMGIIA